MCNVPAVCSNSGDHPLDFTIPHVYVTPLLRQIIMVLWAHSTRSRFCFSLPCFFVFVPRCFDSLVGRYCLCNTVRPRRDLIILPWDAPFRRPAVLETSVPYTTPSVVWLIMHNQAVFVFPGNYHLCTSDSQIFSSPRRSDFGQSALIMLPLR